MQFSAPVAFLAGSAAFVGLVHSLAPGHWLPVVLMTKTRRWPVRTAVLGALTAASGHILVSTILGFISIEIGAHLFEGVEETVEHYGSIALVVFGLIYATLAWFRHSSCSGHEHHGPEPTRDGKGGRGAFAFLFFLGFSPCIAVLPVFAAAAPHGTAMTVLTMICFSIGVITALVSGTVLVSLGVMKLDHPLFEHYGDVITGLGVAVMGVILALLPHSGH